jgi:hypothetical protein
MGVELDLLFSLHGSKDDLVCQRQWFKIRPKILADVFSCHSIRRRVFCFAFPSLESNKGKKGKVVPVLN